MLHIQVVQELDIITLVLILVIQPNKQQIKVIKLQNNHLNKLVLMVVNLDLQLNQTQAHMGENLEQLHDYYNF
jgi:hypothetical protein